MAYTLLNETHYLDVKIVNSPTNFIACIGKCFDYTEFNKFARRLNEWCNQKCAFTVAGGINKPNEVNLNSLHTNDSLLVKHARHTDTHEMMWRRGKIHSIDFKQ
jgi:hypothetical protein